MEGDGGLTRATGGLGGYECTLELLARPDSGVSPPWKGPVIFVREVNDRAASV